ncbi:hypothetical protein [uncultured Ruegeria sp.]|uniref:hypothetical protein n=1 Tax=uncultured Ruegeria sp. TaxID=259304 RepID=UPI0026295438|nr:hypothetical protein [uncultured Ruegeria sp.]
MKLFDNLTGAVGFEGWNSTGALRSFGSVEKESDGSRQIDVASDWQVKPAIVSQDVSAEGTPFLRGASVLEAYDSRFASDADSHVATRYVVGDAIEQD